MSGLEIANYDSKKVTVTFSYWLYSRPHSRGLSASATVTDKLWVLARDLLLC